jgi:hypothetical protein
MIKRLSQAYLLSIDLNLVSSTIATNHYILGGGFVSFLF